MFRAIFVCAIVSASVIACATTTHPANPKATADKTAADMSTSPKRTYSQKDIERTGQTNVGDALQMLDPSITVHH